MNVFSLINVYNFVIDIPFFYDILNEYTVTNNTTVLLVIVYSVIILYYKHVGMSIVKVKVQ
jgi:hypothetical protein